MGAVGAQRLVAVVLILAVVCLRGIQPQQARPGEPRKPFFERFRRLEEQFRRFQEVTLTRLQEIAGNYNISYNIDASFRHLQDKQEALESVANVTHAAMQGELHRLKTWVKKLQNKTKKVDVKVAALDGSLQERARQGAAETRLQRALLSNLTREVGRHKEDTQAVRAGQGDLQKVLESLQDALKNQGAKLAELEQLVKNPPAHNEVFLPSPLAAGPLLGQSPPEKEPEAAGRPSLALKKLRAKHRQRKKLQRENRRLMAQSQNGSLPGQKPSPREKKPESPPQPESRTPEQELPPMDKASEELAVPEASRPPGTICNVGAMLVFPNASTENFAAFQPSFPTSLLELSLCSWVRTHATYLGTILSYATEDNDNKLVLHGRDAAPRNAIHFVIGDPAFRELPVGRLLDGQWHHVCVIWSSIQGRYWFYVDRRLASMGSRFQKGYEIPERGSLVLGQEQDTLGGGFEPSEAFVGLLAGFAVWDRALAPGEVSGIAIGDGLPRGLILSLANVTKLAGAVQKVPAAARLYSAAPLGDLLLRESLVWPNEPSLSTPTPREEPCAHAKGRVPSGSEPATQLGSPWAPRAKGSPHHRQHAVKGGVVANPLTVSVGRVPEDFLVGVALWGFLPGEPKQPAGASVPGTGGPESSPPFRKVFPGTAQSSGPSMLPWLSEGDSEATPGSSSCPQRTPRPPQSPPRQLGRL